MSVTYSPRKTRKQRKVQNNIDDSMSESEDRQWMRERSELRGELEQLRAELASQRSMIAVANESRANSCATSTNSQSEGDMRTMVAGLIDHLQYTRLDMPTPRFCENTQSNPIEFLSDIERFFRCKGVREEQMLVVIETLLSGRARTWFVVNRNNFETYAHFKRAFMDQFYSIPVQVRIRNRWRDRKYYVSEGTCLEYFYKQTKAAQYLEPRMTTYETNYCIIEQLPSRIKDILAVVDFANTNLITQALERLDNNRDKEAEMRKGTSPWDRDRNKERPMRGVNRIARDARYDARARENQNRYYQNVPVRDRNYRGRRDGESTTEDCFDNNHYNRDIRLPDVRYPPPYYRSDEVNGHLSSSVQHQSSGTGHLN